MPIVTPNTPDPTTVEQSKFQRNPVSWLHTVLAIVIGLGTILANAIGDMPADANWTVVAVIVIQAAFAYLIRQKVFSPATVVALLRHFGVNDPDIASVLANKAKSMPPRTGGE